VDFSTARFDSSYRVVLFHFSWRAMADHHRLEHSPKGMNHHKKAMAQLTMKRRRLRDASSGAALVTATTQ